MGVKGSTLAMLLSASVAVVSGEASAIILGELQAVPGHRPPYVFRMALGAAPQGSVDIPAVTVRQPHDALALVKDHTLELRLRSVTDVELDISQGDQTLNRLLLKSELQAARARAQAEMAWDRYQTAKAKSATHPQLAARLDSASQAYQAWAHFDPAAAQQGLARVAQERGRLLAAGVRPADPVIQEAPRPEGVPLGGQLPAPEAAGLLEKATAEREVQEIRAAIQTLMARVTPWAAPEVGAGPPAGDAAMPMWPLLLGGVCSAGVISFFTGYLMQRQASERRRQRRRVRSAARRWARVELPAGTSALPSGRRDQRSKAGPVRPPPVAVVRRVRVSHQAQRRIRVHPPPDTRGSPRPRAAELIEALETLRQGLLRGQRPLPTSTSSEGAEVDHPRRAR